MQSRVVVEGGGEWHKTLYLKTKYLGGIHFQKEKNLQLRLVFVCSLAYCHQNSVRMAAPLWHVKEAVSSSYLWSGIWWHRRWAWPWLGRGPRAHPVQHIWQWRHRHPGPLVCRSHRKFHPHCPGRKDGWRCHLGAVGRQKANVWAKQVSVLWMGFLWVVQREGEKLHCCLTFHSDQELLPMSAANSAFWPAVCRKVHNLWSTIHNNYKCTTFDQLFIITTSAQPLINYS